MKVIKPNTVLPKRGKLLTPFREKLGNWVEMSFDAEVFCAGVRWLRVQRGMSGNNDREDWVADVPHCCASVHDYQFRPPYWGIVKYTSFESACLAELKNTLKEAKLEMAQLASKLHSLKQVLARFEKT